MSTSPAVVARADADKHDDNDDDDDRDSLYENTQHHNNSSSSHLAANSNDAADEISITQATSGAQPQNNPATTVTDNNNNNNCYAMPSDYHLNLLDGANSSVSALAKSSANIHARSRFSSGGESDDARRVRRVEKTTVQVRVDFETIGKIDTLKELYSAEICIRAYWPEPKLNGMSPRELEEQVSHNASSLWNPNLYVVNLQSEAKRSTVVTASLNRRGEAYVSQRVYIRGDFFENLELQNFPFDVQDLSVTVVSELPESEVNLEYQSGSVALDTFANEQEWKLDESVVSGKSKQKRELPAIQVTCRATRRAGHFYYNVFPVLVSISSIAFGTFSVDCQLPQNRLQLTFTLLLTLVAFKMVINNSLPKIPYLTLMDRYVMMSLMFLILICVWHSIAPIICADSFLSPDSFYATKKENFVVLAFFIVYAIGHVVFAFFVYYRRRRRRLQMAQQDRVFRESMAQLSLQQQLQQQQQQQQQPTVVGDVEAQQFISTALGQSQQTAGLYRQTAL